MMKLIKRLFVLAALAATLVVGVLVAQMLSFTNSEVNLPREDTVFLIKSGSNIKAIAQGSSELTIAIVVKRDGLEKAVQAVHAECNMAEKANHPEVIGSR